MLVFNFSRRYVHGVRAPLLLGYVLSALPCLGAAMDLSDRVDIGVKPTGGNTICVLQIIRELGRLSLQ